MATPVPSPQGLVPHEYLGGSPWNGKTRPYTILNGYSTNIFIGDPVCFDSASGTIKLFAASGSRSATSPILGVFMGVKYTLPGIANVANSWPYYQGGVAVATGSTIIAQIVDDPFVIFKCQSNDPNGFPMSVDGLNFNLVAGTGNPQTYQSGYAANQGASSATDATFDLKLIGAQTFSPTGMPNWSNGTGSVPYNNGLFLINNHKYRSGTAGV